MSSGNFTTSRTRAYSKYENVAARVAPTFPGPGTVTAPEHQATPSALGSLGFVLSWPPLPSGRSLWSGHVGRALGFYGWIARRQLQAVDGSWHDRLGCPVGCLGFDPYLHRIALRASRTVSDPNAPKVTQINYVKPEEQIRIVQYKSAARLVDGVDVRDLCWFIEGLAERGHSQRAWLGLTTPTSRLVDPMCGLSYAYPYARLGSSRGFPRANQDDW